MYVEGEYSTGKILFPPVLYIKESCISSKKNCIYKVNVSSPNFKLNLIQLSLIYIKLKIIILNNSL